MKRRRILGTAGGAFITALSGCGYWDPGSGRNGGSENGSDATEQPVSERFDCAETDRLEPDVPAGTEFECERNDSETDVFESVGAAEYPAAPATLRESDIEAFTRAHEEAFLQNKFVASHGERATGFEVTFDAVQVVDQYEAVPVVRVDTRSSAEVVTDDCIEAVLDGRGAAAYAVDETGAVRVETEHRSDLDGEGSSLDQTPNPLVEGTVVVCF